MRIVAYTYEAAAHCPDCAAARFGGPGVGNLDEHGVGEHARDREGNRVWPVFDLDEGWQGERCDTCGADFEDFA